MGCSVKSWIKTAAVLFALLTISAGCAHHAKLPPEEVYAVYSAPRDSREPIKEYVPLFLTYDYRNAYNRIGKPKAEKTKGGDVQIFVDPGEPVIYTMEKDFSTTRGDYRNLIYRIHFSEVPFSIVPFNLTWGDNVGLMVVITLDSRERPVLVTTVHTCGCYVAIVPTTELPRDAFPENWSDETLEVFGEKLPPILDFRGRDDPRLMVHIRPEVHRVMDLEVVENRHVEVSKIYRLVGTVAEPVRILENLPLEGETVSFYHEDGFMQGYVKGSVKPFETMFLSLPSLDLFVGADKAYDDPEKTENPFYTSLKPWNRHESNMWFFDRFLYFHGWRL